MPGPAPFAFVGRRWGLNWGIQHVALGAGGPQGFQDARAYHATPWPNRPQGFVNFTSPWPWGTATTMARNPNFPDIWSGHPAVRPLGYQKPLTGSGYSF